MALEEIGAKLIAAGETQFLSAMSKSEKAMDKFGDSTGRAHKPTEGLTAKSLALATAMGQALYNAAINAAKAIVGFAKESVTAASDLNETVSKAGIVFEQQGDAMIRWSKTSAEAFGMSQNEALGAAATYGNLFRSMNIGSMESAHMSAKLVELSGDLASFNNMAPEEVLEKLRAGLTGESEPLKSLGININEVILKEKALELGLYNGKGALTASAKAQAAYALMLEQTTLAQGDFARTSDGLANQQRIFAANIENTKAQLGGALLPVVNMAVKALNSWLNSEWFKNAMTGFTTGIQTAIAWITANWPKISEVFQQVWTVVSGIFTNAMNFLSGPVSGALTGFSLLWKWTGSDIQSTVNLIWGYVQAAFEKIWITIQTIIAMILPYIRQFLGSIIVFWKANGDEIMATVEKIWKTVYELFSAAINLIVTIVSFFLENLRVFWNAHGMQIMEIVTQIWQVVATIFTTAVTVITNIFKAFTALLKGDTDAFAIYMKIAWQALWTALKHAAETAWAALSKWFQGVVKSIGEFFTKTDWGAVGKSIIDGIWRGLQGGWDWLKSQVANLAKSLFDSAKKALGIKSPSTLFEGIGINMMVGWEKGILENAMRPMGATAMATQMAIAPAAAVSAGPSTYNYNTQNAYNLSVMTNQSPQVVQNSFAMMQLLAG